MKKNCMLIISKYLFIYLLFAGLIILSVIIVLSACEYVCVSINKNDSRGDKRQKKSLIISLAMKQIVFIDKYVCTTINKNYGNSNEFIGWSWLIIRTHRP